MADAALFQWTDVLWQCVGFLGSFGMLGAVGYRYGVGRPLTNATQSAAIDSANARAGVIGAIGAALGGVAFAESLTLRAASKHTTFGAAFAAGGTMSVVQAALLGVLFVAFLVAWRRVPVAWPIAATAAVALALRGIAVGDITKMVNPLHVLGASLWIGSLFFLVACGVREMLREAMPTADREAAVSTMVHRFSFVALPSALLLGVTGVITAWTHLKHLDALWTTAYGYALMAKLSMVAVVAGLGAWNWRRVGPSLGTPGGALAIRRSATTELVFAGVVVVLTGILVSIHTPKPPADSHQPPAALTAPSAS